MVRTSGWRPWGRGAAETGLLPVCCWSHAARSDAGFPRSAALEFLEVLAGQALIGGLTGRLAGAAAKYSNTTAHAPNLLTLSPPLNQMIIFGIGPGVAAVPDGATGFSHRDANYLFRPISAWLDPAVGERVIAAIRSFAAAMRSSSTGASCLNVTHEEVRVRDADGAGNTSAWRHSKTPTTWPAYFGSTNMAQPARRRARAQLATLDRNHALPSNASCNAWTSSFLMPSIALVARAAPCWSGDLIIWCSARESICHDRPYLSVSHPQGPSFPPSAVSLSHSWSISSCESQVRWMETASSNLNSGPPLRPMNCCPSSSNVTIMTEPFSPGPASP